jgi:transcriptional antiterminator
MRYRTCAKWLREKPIANTATRLITLIMLLQRQPNQTAAQLAQTLAVSMHTVQRYITMLDERGSCICLCWRRRRDLHLSQPFRRPS